MHKLLKFLLLPLLCCFQLHVNAQINTNKMMTVGRNALYFEDYILSIQYFNKVIRVKPYLTDPYYYRAIAKFYLEDYKGAERDCSKAIEINPFMVEAYNIRGITRQRMEDPQSALNDFTIGLNYESNNVNLLFNRGICKSVLKEYEGAIKDYSSALAIDPKLVGAMLNRGMAKVAVQDTIGGLKDLEAAILINPYRSQSYVSRAIVYYQIGDFNQSLADFSKAITLSSRDVQLYLNRAIVLYQLGDLNGMMADFDKAIQLDPKNAVAYSNRGVLRAEVGDYNRAIDDFSRVLAIDPSNTLILYYRSLLYIEIKQLGDALRGLNIVAETYPEFAPLYASRAKVKQLMNDFEGAKIDQMTAYKLESDRRAKGDASKETKEEESSDAAVAAKQGHKKATRKTSDKNLDNYNRIVVLDDFEQEESKQETGETIRGKVQNRNFVIDLETVFGTSFYSIDSMSQRSRYYEKSVEEINNKSLFDRKLFLTNREAEEDDFNSVRHFTYINTITKEIEKATSSPNLYLVRGVLYSVVINYNNAIKDYSKLIDLDSDNVLAYFNRAYTRFKMVEAFQEFEQESGEIASVNSISGQKLEVKTNILDYDLIMRDLNRVIELDDQFEFAYYNRAILKCLLKDFSGALTDFNRAILLNTDFAEAYFNRGLTRIYLNDEEGGTLDLSHAGELGLYKAYNVIKRYGSMVSEREKVEMVQ